MFDEIPCAVCGFFDSMDSETSSFQSGLTVLPPANVPPRVAVVMPAGEIVTWTPPRLFQAAFAWLMAETQLPASMSAHKRHA